MNYFQINKNIINFNCSYGTVPKMVKEYQEKLLSECESNPYEWFTKTYREKLDVVRQQLSSFLHCQKCDLVFVDNTSSGANSVFNSISFHKHSAIIILDIAYGLILNLANKINKLTGCYIHTISVDIREVHYLPYQISNAIDMLKMKNYQVYLVCCDHISSCPGILLPVKDIAKACLLKNVPLLVDAAHAIGQVEINLDELGKDGVRYWVTDCHKWFFSPKGAALLWVHKEKQDTVFPVIDCATIGTKGCITEKNSLQLSDFESRFLYLGTKDYTPWLSVRKAIYFVELMGGYSHIIKRNREFTLKAQEKLCLSLNTKSLFRDDTIVSMINVPLPKCVSNNLIASRLMKALKELYKIYVVIYEYPCDSSNFYLRLCTQLFIQDEEIDCLTKAIQILLPLLIE
tara:strand:- start:295 stop:1500 length:1206 start_codon:yes stop_codon:yes gene_type:complete